MSLQFALKSPNPAQKPHLTEAVKKKRLTFAKRYTNYDNRDAAKVLVADESSMKQLPVRKSRVSRAG